jgi:hypothetical protein
MCLNIRYDRGDCGGNPRLVPQLDRCREVRRAIKLDWWLSDTLGGADSSSGSQDEWMLVALEWLHDWLYPDDRDREYFPDSLDGIDGRRIAGEDDERRMKASEPRGEYLQARGEPSGRLVPIGEMCLVGDVEV